MAIGDVGFDWAEPGATSPPASAIPIETPPKPATGRETSHAVVDEWLAEVDVKVAKASAVLQTDGPARATPAADAALQMAVARARENSRDALEGLIPRTFLQRTLRRWLRRLWGAALRVLGVGIVILVPVVLWNVSRELSEPVVLPALPAAPAILLAPTLKLVEPPVELPEDYFTSTR